MAELSIKPTSGILKIGQTLKIEVTTSDNDYKVYYTTNNVCIFDKDTSTLTALKEGTCEVIFKINENTDEELQASFNLEVKAVLEQTRLEISPASVTFKEEETQVLTIDTEASDYSYSIEDVSIVKYNKDLKMLTALKQGETTIRFTAQAEGKESTIFDLKCKVEAKSNIDNTPTELEVYPTNVNLKVGEKATLDIVHNAKFINYDIAQAKIISFNKMTKTIRAIGEGQTTLNIKARKEGQAEVVKAVNVSVEKQEEGGDDDFDNNLENSYYYDDTLPLTQNGVIAYKCGYAESDPLIKLRFNASNNTWDIIGIKIIRYNKNNEPYDLYFMASEGMVNEELTTIGLQQIILDLVNQIIEQKTPDIEKKITDLFNTLFPPLIEDAKNEIPEMIREEFEKNYPDAFIEQIQKFMAEYDLGGYMPYPYHKEKQKPKWVGLVLLHENTLTSTNYVDTMMTKRLNTNGIEETWLPMQYERINMFRNDDPLTRLFDNIEPYKSMGRYEMDMKMLSEVQGDAIYGKTMFQKIQEEHSKKLDKFWNGEFYAGLTEAQISARDSAWGVPIKKCYYIDVEIKIDGYPAGTTYFLRAVGEEEFEVDLKEAISPNIGSFTLSYLRCDAVGYKEFRIKDNTKIVANIHPAFYSYYDQNLAGITTPIEKDYIWIGAFKYCNVATTAHSKGVNTSGTQVLPKPFLAVNTANTFRSLSTSYMLNTYGNNPAQGVNWQNLSYYYAHLVWIMQEIEMGYVARRNSADNRWAYAKWAVANSMAQHTQMTGATWRLNNKSGAVWQGSYPQYNYRGLENFTGNYWTWTEDIIHKGDKRVWLHKPSTHRRLRAYTYDNVNWIDTGHTNVYVIDGESANKKVLANSMACFQASSNNLKTYSLDCNETSEAAFFFGSSVSVALYLGWSGVGGVYWNSGGRPCV